MSDSEAREAAKAQSRDQLVREFLAESARDVERMRAATSATENLDPTSWRRFQNVAHNMAARAQTFQLGVLQMCARELEQFVIDILANADGEQTKAVDAVMVAIETISLELDALAREMAPR